MTFEDFLREITKQLYVWRMAEGNLNQRMLRSRQTRLTRTRRRLDDLILARAATIADERRCAALREVGTAAPRQPGDPEEILHVRCEYAAGHGPVAPGPFSGPQARAAVVTSGQQWDHAAPKAGVWWMDEEKEGTDV